MGSPEDGQASSQPVVVRGRGKNKKFWNAMEEATLIDILAEMNANSWKTDNGYKNGYCHHIEKQIEERLPGCGLKADPHIESKVKIFKRHLNYILRIDENCKDFWWDKERKMVVGDKEAFLTWAKNHEGAASLFMKPFIHFDKLYEIYGKKSSNKKRDLATAEATDAADQLAVHIVNHGSDIKPNVREDSPSTTQSTIAPPSDTNNEKSKKQREFGPVETEFTELSKTIRVLAEAQKDLALAMINMKKNPTTLDEEISEQRKTLFSVLLKLQGLSPVEVVKAARIIGQDDRKIEVFYSLPDDYKLIFARLEIESFY